MKRKYEMILSAEESFARTVALGVLVKRPLTTWHYLIPGMFIFDFLRRSSEIREYSNHFLFPRKLALDTAYNICSNQIRDETVSRVSEKVEVWLNSLGLYSENLYRNQTEVIQFLVDHYCKLIGTEGESYHSLIENAYGYRRNYETFLTQITKAEKRVDQAIVEKLGQTDVLRNKLLAEEQEVERMRKKQTDLAFSS